MVVPLVHGKNLEALLKQRNDAEIFVQHKKGLYAVFGLLKLVATKNQEDLLSLIPPVMPALPLNVLHRLCYHCLSGAIGHGLQSRAVSRKGCIRIPHKSESFLSAVFSLVSPMSPLICV